MATPNKLSKFREEVITSYNNGLSLRQIATLHECNPGTVRNFLRLEGVQVRGRGRVKKVQEVVEVQ